MTEFMPNTEDIFYALNVPKKIDEALQVDDAAEAQRLARNAALFYKDKGMLKLAWLYSTQGDDRALERSLKGEVINIMKEGG